MKDKVLEVLNDRVDALNLIAINDLIDLKTAEELKMLENSLEDLYKENIVYKTNKGKYILYKNCPDFKIGKLDIKKAGFGFVLMNDEEDIFVAKDNLNGAINDDLVLVELNNPQDKTEGRVVRILNRDLKNLVGEIKVKNNDVYVVLDDEDKKIDIVLDKISSSGLVDGTKVLVTLIKELSKNKYYGRVVSVIGHKDDPGVDIKSIAMKYGIFEEFSKESNQQAEEMPNEVSEEDKKGRTDLTDEIIFTIDGDDTKDIDDAISIKKEGDNYILGVHIADVSNYVTLDSPLDLDAYERGTSSYLADSVIPMLPHKLSNGICSLNPNVERLTISCVMTIDKNGNTIDYDIFPSVIKSKIKMTYKKVNNILMRNIVDSDYEIYKEKLFLMNELAHVLRKHKVNKGYIDFNLDEPKIICDKNKKVIDIIRDEREDGEKLIEDFMIAANECVASHIYNMDLPFIYRVHDVPSAEKIEQFLGLVSALGYSIKGKFKTVTSKDMQRILEQLADKPEVKMLSSLLLRSMKKAVYLKDNIGHFGLASSCYTHFTSPIRRYPDLIVHRLLRMYLFNKDMSVETINYWNGKLVQIAEQASDREQKAVEAEREVNDMKMAEYMENHIGEEFDGVISGVTNFGFFVQLDNLIEGLVHVNTLKGDYYNHVENLMSLIGENTKKTYRMGDRVRVKCIAASKEAKQIDFIVVQGGEKDGNKK